LRPPRHLGSKPGWSNHEIAAVDSAGGLYVKVNDLKAVRAPNAQRFAELALEALGSRIHRADHALTPEPFAKGLTWYFDNRHLG
jgi:hypothetical protein